MPWASFARLGCVEGARVHEVDEGYVMSESKPKTLSEQEIAQYVAADAALTTTKPWEFVATSKRMKMWAWIAAAVFFFGHIFLAYIVAVGDSGVAVTSVDQLGYFLVGVVLAILSFIGLSRPRVRANADGVDVRNFLGSHFYPWAVIYGISFPEGAKMARLELPDFEFVPIWALQAKDGERTVKALAEARELEAKYMPED